MYVDDIVPLSQISTVQTTLVDMRRLGDKGIAYIGDAATQATIDKDLAADDEKMATALADYSKASLTASDKARSQDLETQLAAYQKARDEARTVTKQGDPVASKAAADAARAFSTQAAKDIADLVAMQLADAKAERRASITSTYGSSLLLMIVGIIMSRRPRLRRRLLARA